MKGTILTCLRELVTARKGVEAWRSALILAKIDPTTFFMLNQDVDEAEAVELFKASVSALDVAWPELYDAFGQYWCVDYAPRIYKSFYSKHKNVRSFMLDINDMHARLTAAIPNARPPRFKLVSVGEKSLVVTYESPRGLIDLAVGLARGMGAYFREQVIITKLSTVQFRIDF